MTAGRWTLLGFILIGVGTVLGFVFPDVPPMWWWTMTVPGGMLVGWNIMPAIHNRKSRKRSRREFDRLASSEWRLDRDGADD